MTMDAGLRILFWQEPLWPPLGGMQIQAGQLLPALRRRGHEITIVTRRNGADEPSSARWHGMAVRRFSFWQALNAGSVDEIVALQRELVALERELAPDLIHLNGFGPSALFHLRSARVSPTPTVLTLHSWNTLSSVPGSVARQLLDRADWVTACSRALLAEAQRCAPAIGPCSSVIVNGVAPFPVAPMPLPAEPRVLCIGRLDGHKGFDLAVRATALLRRRRPSLRLTIVGEGPERTALERLAEEAGAGDAVELTGAVPHAELAHRINDATVVAIPSRRETFSLVAVEAALMRRPVVAARTGGLPEVVADGETGLLVEPDSAPALAGAIDDVIMNRELGARMGAAGQRRATALFGLQRCVEEYEALYRQVARPGLAAEGAGARPCA